MINVYVLIYLNIYINIHIFKYTNYFISVEIKFITVDSYVRQKIKK